MSEGYVTIIRKRGFFTGVQRKPARVLAELPGAVVLRVDRQRVRFDRRTKRPVSAAHKRWLWRLP